MKPRWPSLLQSSVLALMACASLAGCSAKKEPAAGELMLLIDTDMRVPQDLDRIRLEIADQDFDASGFSADFRIGTEIKLPATYAIVAGSNPQELVAITVSGFLGTETTPRVVRRARTQVPPDRVASVALVLHWACSTGQFQQTCASDETCDNGKCIPADLDSVALPTYRTGDEQLIHDGGSLTTEASVAADGRAPDGSTIAVDTGSMVEASTPDDASLVSDLDAGKDAVSPMLDTGSPAVDASKEASTMVDASKEASTVVDAGGCTSTQHFCTAAQRCAANDDVTACGTSCASCSVPAGGHAACQLGACQSTCDGTDVLCGAACVNLATNAANCGVCGQDCGRGALCVAAVCQPAELTLAPFKPVGGLALDGTKMYFGDGTNIVSCPIDGCTVAPAQVWSGNAVDQLAAGVGVLAYQGQTDTGRTGVYSCSETACTPTLIHGGDMLTTVDNPKIYGASLYYHTNIYGIPTYAADSIFCVAAAVGGCNGVDTHSGKPPIASAGTNLYYSSTSMADPSNFVRCATTGACAPVDVTSTTNVVAIGALGDQMFVARSGLVGPNLTKWIDACPALGCPSPIKVTNTTTALDVAEIAADASGVYWIYGGDAGSIWMCAPNGCPGGARLVAGQQANAIALQLQGNFVYWAARGDAGGTAGTFGVRRVAKPVIN